MHQHGGQRPQFQKFHRRGPLGQGAGPERRLLFHPIRPQRRTGKGPDRETDPATTYPQNLARYVDDVRAIGGKPVLVTSLTRRNFDKSGNGKLAPNLLPYVEAMKRVAAENMCRCWICTPTAWRCVSGLARWKPPSSIRSSNGKPDTTHLNAGARVVFARLVVAELRQAVPELAPYLRHDPFVCAGALIRRQHGKQMDSRKNAQNAQKNRSFCAFWLLCGQFVFTVCSPSRGLLSKPVTRSTKPARNPPMTKPTYLKCPSTST